MRMNLQLPLTGREEGGVTEIVGLHDGRIQRGEIQSGDRSAVIPKRKSKITDKMFSSKFDIAYIPPESLQSHKIDLLQCFISLFKSLQNLQSIMETGKI